MPTAYIPTIQPSNDEIVTQPPCPMIKSRLRRF
jgi:hypothetical protein